MAVIPLHFHNLFLKLLKTMPVHDHTFYLTLALTTKVIKNYACNEIRLQMAEIRVESYFIYVFIVPTNYALKYWLYKWERIVNLL